MTSDMRFFQRWASTAAELRIHHGGIGKIYTRVKDCNYPPLYLIILSYLPAVDAWWHGEAGWEIPRVTKDGKRRASPHFRTRNHLRTLAPVLKLPAIVADLGITFLVLAWVWVRGSPQRGVLAAGLWALNPLAVYNGAYFGQIDAIHSLWMLGALLAAVDRRFVVAWSLMALALLTKFQSVVIVPVVGVLTLESLLTAIRSADRTALTRQLRTLVLAAVAVVAIGWMILAPFIRDGTLGGVKRAYTDAVNEKGLARITVIAYNFWWLTLDVPVRFPSIPRDVKPLIGPFTARHMGFAMLGLLSAAASLMALWGGGRRSAMVAAAAIALAFFVVSTQMKARYGFASLVLLLPLLAYSYRYAAAIAVLTATFLLNGARVLPLPSDFFGFTYAVNSLTRLAWAGHAVAVVNVCVLAYLCFDLTRVARHERSRAGELDQRGA